MANLPGLFDDFSNNLTSVLPISLYYDHHNEATQEFITSRIIDFYFNNEMPSPENLNNVTNVSTKLKNNSTNILCRFRPIIPNIFIFLFCYSYLQMAGSWKETMHISDRDYHIQTLRRLTFICLPTRVPSVFLKYSAVVKTVTMVIF